MAVGFYFDMTRCIGCRACQVACKDKNRLEVGTLYRDVKTYTVGTFPDVTSYSYSFSCNHCDDPICMHNCPTGAIYKAEDGTVIQDQSLCIGCRMCVMSCPYGQPKFLEELGVSGKCDGCYGIRQEGGEPACVAPGVLSLLLEQARDGAGVGAGLDAAAAQEGVLGEPCTCPHAGTGRGRRGARHRAA